MPTYLSAIQQHTSPYQININTQDQPAHIYAKITQAEFSCSYAHPRVLQMQSVRPSPSLRPSFNKASDRLSTAGKAFR
jgi:hypothetical protein